MRHLMVTAGAWALVLAGLACDTPEQAIVLSDGCPTSEDWAADNQGMDAGGSGRTISWTGLEAVDDVEARGDSRLLETEMDAGATDGADEPQPESDVSAWADLEEPEADVESGASEIDWLLPCEDDVVCVTTFPFIDVWDTQSSTLSAFDSYGCAPETDESGPEVLYQVVVPEAGFLSVAVEDEEGVDVDVHILEAVDPDACLDRGHHHARADVEAGVYLVVVDTFVSGGMAFAGEYTVHIGWLPPSQGLCEMESGVMKRVGDGGNHLVMPATGPVVMEAHLVTQDEPEPFPSTSTEELLNHYALSESVTGLVMYRSQSWAPLEGGSFYGAGIGSPSLFPVEDEGWYICMYWTSESRPDLGTRMILKDPYSGRAVVVAAGYETGPGNLANIGGTVEETHFYLGTGHKSELTLGIASDQTLPLGPRECL